MTASTSYAQAPRLRADVDQLHGERVLLRTPVRRLGSRLVKDLGRLQFVQDLQRTRARVPELERAVLVARYDNLRVTAGHGRPLASTQRPLVWRKVGPFTARSTDLRRDREQEDRENSSVHEIGLIANCGAVLVDCCVLDGGCGFVVTHTHTQSGHNKVAVERN